MVEEVVSSVSLDGPGDLMATVEAASESDGVVVLAVVAEAVEGLLVGVCASVPLPLPLPLAFEVEVEVVEFLRVWEPLTPVAEP